MRKITIKAAAAFESGRNFSESNTFVGISFEGGELPNAKLFLFGNCIAERDAKGRVYICACHWQSNTTKERLNALRGVDIRQKNYQWYLNGKPWNGERVCLQEW